MNWRREEGVEMSWFAMAEWPGRKLGKLDPEKEVEPIGRLDSFEISVELPTSEDGEQPEPMLVSLPVWTPPGYEKDEARYSVVYVANETAREIGNWPRALDRVIGKTAAPVIAVFLELPDLPGQNDILARQIVPAVDKHYRTIADRDHRGVVGMGWPGLGAALDAFGDPDLFGVLGVQSFFALEEQLTMLRGAIGDNDASTLPFRIYLEWGRWDLISPHEEMNMRASSRQVWDLLTEKGWEPIGGEVWDSTDWASWSNRTGTMLEALFPLAGAESSLAAWQTSAP